VCRGQAEDECRGQPAGVRAVVKAARVGARGEQPGYHAAGPGADPGVGVDQQAAEREGDGWRAEPSGRRSEAPVTRPPDDRGEVPVTRLPDDRGEVPVTRSPDDRGQASVTRSPDDRSDTVLVRVSTCPPCSLIRRSQHAM
jgi:hypothetical protein